MLRASNQTVLQENRKAENTAELLLHFPYFTTMKSFAQFVFFVFVYANGFGQELELKLFSVSPSRKMFAWHPDYIIYTIENKSGQRQTSSRILFNVFDSEGNKIEERNNSVAHLPDINRNQDTIEANTKLYKLIPSNSIRGEFDIEYGPDKISFELFLLTEKNKVVLSPIEFQYSERRPTQDEFDIASKTASLIHTDIVAYLNFTSDLLPKIDKDIRMYLFYQMCYVQHLPVALRKESLLKFLPYPNDEHTCNVIAFIAARDYEKNDPKNSILENYLKKYNTAFDIYKRVVKQEHGITLD